MGLLASLFVAGALSVPLLLNPAEHVGHDEPDGADTTAVEDTASAEGESPWLVSELHGPTHTVRFDTDEATFINVDVHPDGGSLVFDILGDLYTLPMAGGQAQRITSGPAYDHQPRFSPDGTRLLFTSDRGGADNVWTMNADGSNLRPLTAEDSKVMNTADWSPDGEYIVARRRLTDRSSIGTVELWLHHTLGGKGLQITKKLQIPDSSGPTFAPDGRWIYFAARNARYRYNRNVYAGIWQIRAYDRHTGRFRTITDGYGGAGRPRLSPDGSTLAFVRRDRAKSVLILHDLATGSERRLIDTLDQDMQENFNYTGVYSGYDWTPDGSAIVISFGGKIHRVNVATGAASPIPFTATVDQEVVEQLRFPRDIAPDKVRVRMISWPQRTADGDDLIFAALGKLYRVPLAGGQPRVLNTQGARAYAPQLSPNGRDLAYASWTDSEGGNIWVMSLRSGGSTRVTRTPGQYSSPAFSADGKNLVFLKGGGATNRGGILGGEPHLELWWAPVTGGEPRFVTEVVSRGSARPMPRPRWSPHGNRIFYLEDVGPGTEQKSALVSIRLDGTERREHIKVKQAEEMVLSPDGKWVAYSRLFEGFVVPLSPLATQTVELDGEDGPVPSHRFAREGVTWLQWSTDSRSLTWSLGPDVYVVDLADIETAWLQAGLEAGDKTVPADTTDADAEDKPERDTAVHPDTFTVTLELPRHTPRGTLALTGARLITMNGDEVIEQGTVVVENDRITAVGAVGSVTIPVGAHVVDVTGQTIMPGMVDAHAHMHYSHMDIIPEAMSSYYANLAYGITTTHDPSASTYNVFTQSEMVETGLAKGPRTFSTGFILYGADIFDKAVIKNLEDAKRHTRRLKKQGAFSVKSYMQPRRIQRQWLLEAARGDSMLVMPEGGGDMEANMGMVIDGHTGIEHSLPVAPLYNDVVQLFAQTGVGYTPTLLVAYGGLSGEHWFYQHNEVWQNQKLLRFLPRGEVDARSRRRPIMATDDDWHHMAVAEGCKRVVEAGGKVQLGGHGQLQGLGCHWELWALTQGGMKPHDALRCATLFGAQYLGLDGQLGSIEAGKLADLVVMRDNPLEDIHNSDSISWVVKNGELFEGDTMNQVYPETRPCPQFYWQRGE